jgi:NAD(P)-dependent dehydrogenase (short-subunit alcohol dehydrogenase family)
MDLNLRGKKVLVTGASKGIGEAVAFGFAAEGADVILAARDGAKMGQIEHEIRGRHQVNVKVVPTDLRDGAALQALADAAGDIDILVNNAGDIPGGTLDKVDEATWRHAWELKVFGYINLCRLILPKLLARKSGVIVNVIGTGGERLTHGYIAGSTGNAALMAFTRALGSASLIDNVRVVGLNPGAVLTDRVTGMFKSVARERWGDESRYQELLDAQPANSMSMPEDIADMVVFLASDRARRVSGTIVTVDGGMANYHGLAS